MSKHFFRMRCLIVAGILAWAMAAPYTSFAQEADPPLGVFVVRPAKTEVNIAPGETKIRQITLSNGTPAPLRVKITFEDMAPLTQGTAQDDPIQLLRTQSGRYSLRELLAAPRMEFDILSGKEVTVPIAVRIPKDAGPGGRFGSVLFTFSPVLPDPSLQYANVSLESRIATLFYVRVEGEVLEEGKLAAFGLFNNKKITSSPRPDAPLRFQVAYENTGTVHLNPYGRLTITPLFGKTETVIIAPFAVLPDATFMLEVNVLHPLFPGYYRAHLELNRGYGNIVDKVQVGFWVASSFKQFLLFLVGIIVLGWFVKRSLQLSRHLVR